MITVMLYGETDSSGKTRNPVDRCEDFDKGAFESSVKAIAQDQATVARVAGWGEHGHVMLAPMVAGGYEAEFIGCRGPVGLWIDLREPAGDSSVPARIQELMVQLATTVHERLVA